MRGELRAGTEIGSLGLPLLPLPLPAIVTPLWTEKETIEDQERSLGPQIYFLKNTCYIKSIASPIPDIPIIRIPSIGSNPSMETLGKTIVS